MNVLLHTIALEPARWLPERVSCPLLQLLPAIAAHGFRDLEIYEPHLQDAVIPELLEAFSAYALRPVVLSSYLDLRNEVGFEAARDVLDERLLQFPFKKVRLFPSGNPDDLPGQEILLQRLHAVATAHPGIEFLLETHDGSLADDPLLLTQLLSSLNLPNLGLLYQPTRFQADLALSQFEIQKPFVRHWHLQNRNPDLSFATLEKGVIPWDQLLPQLQFETDATLEFVPAGIYQPKDFDLEKTLIQAADEMVYLKGLERTWRRSRENGAR